MYSVKIYISVVAKNNKHDGQNQVVVDHADINRTSSIQTKIFLKS